MSSSGSDLNLVDMNLTEVPVDIANQAGSLATTLNLSENQLCAPANLNLFTKVATLILDKNNLSSLQNFPVMKTVTTLWFNNNGMNDIVEFMDEVNALYPNITYLSAMNNPASPPLVCISEEDVAASSRYRLYVIYRLPKLQFLDASPVTNEERKEAQARGQYLAVRKPKQKSTSTMGKPVSPLAVGGVFGAFASSSATPSSSSTSNPTSPNTTTTDSEQKRKPQAFLGLGSSSYDGRHSEGNRFIVDRDL